MLTVIAFHTDDDLYTACARNLKKSLSLYKVDSFVKTIPKADWHSSACYKPSFIRGCMDIYKEGILIYTDADSCLKRNFDLHKDVPAPWSIAYPIAPWGEILSGTIAFRIDDTSKRIVDEWIDNLKLYGPDKSIGDQVQFQRLIKKNMNVCKPLPFQYCKIFDLMRRVENPIFVHYQASRVGRSKQPPKTLLDRLGS